MPEGRFELNPSREVWDRVLERNAIELSNELKQNRNWKSNSRHGLTKTRRVKFYLTDTGHKCEQNDPQMEAVCYANFVSQDGEMSCTYLDCESPDGEGLIHPDLKRMAEFTVDKAAEKASDFPREI